MELKRCNIFTHEKSQHHYLDIWLGIKANIFECLKIENFPVANESIVDKWMSSCLMVLLWYRFPILSSEISENFSGMCWCIYFNSLCVLTNKTLDFNGLWCSRVHFGIQKSRGKDKVLLPLFPSDAILPLLTYKKQIYMFYYMQEVLSKTWLYSRYICRCCNPILILMKSCMCMVSIIYALGN